MKKVLTNLLGGNQQRKTLKGYQRQVDAINKLGDQYKKLTDKQLQAKTTEFKKRLAGGESLDSLLPEAFATVREASVRVLKMRHFDVQLIGGMALHYGNVAEMKTGEGKTLVATLPLYLNALAGKGAHLVTVNDYLAQLHAGWMGELYDYLGLSTAVIIAEHTYIYDRDFSNDEHADARFRHLKEVDTRREGYYADITYGTNNEFGFDYLRDNMVQNPEDLRQRDLQFAIVDEVDSILIDEARTPLIISAPSSNSASTYSVFAQIARRLKADDYELDEKRRTVTINDQGVERVQKWLGVENLYAPENVRQIYHLDQALRAETLFKRDKDYIVSDDGEVIIVDEFTGRLMHGRRYNEGLHQAIEAKEGVEVLQESMTLATISFQNYFRLYEKLAGMTGTAATEAEEFYQIYELDVVEIPPNRPVIRQDLPDRIYRDQKAKFNAITARVKELHEKGQPVLLGTASIEKNELLSKLLTKAKIPHQMLNAKHHESEASIIAKAGKRGAVTLATNIAGRGTDIMLDEDVKELGGLFVLGSERHESRRIDNQLRGRSGRQGDPGASQFFVAADDDLMRIFGGDRVAGLMDRLGVDETMPIENRTLSKALQSAQKKVEGHNFDSRKQVVQFDDVMNRHRKATYKTRRKLLLSENIETDIKAIIEGVIAGFQPQPGDDRKEILEEIQAIVPFDEAAIKKLKRAKDEKFVDVLKKEAWARYEQQEKNFTPQIMRFVEREVYLNVLDNLWMQHLENMDHLREGIFWRSRGGRDPLVEYRREGQQLFETMEATVASETTRLLFHAQPRVEEETENLETELTRAARQATATGASESPDLAATPKKKGRQPTVEEMTAEIEKTTVVATPQPKKNNRDVARKKKKQQRKNRHKGHRH